MEPVKSVERGRFAVPTGEDSVSPQPWQMCRPVTWRHRSETAACTAMPPPSATLSELKSSSLNPGVLSSALNSVLTPVMKVNFTFDSSLTKPGMSRGFVISTLLPPTRVNTSMFVVSAKMW